MARWGHIRVEDPNGWEPPRLERAPTPERTWAHRDPGDQDGPCRDEPTREETQLMDDLETLSRHADTPADPAHEIVVRTRSGRQFGDRELTLEFRGDCSCGHVGIWLMTEIRARAAWARHVERATELMRSVE